jgi:hypothetical protein
MLYYFMVLLHTLLDLSDWCCRVQLSFKNDKGGGIINLGGIINVSNFNETTA